MSDKIQFIIYDYASTTVDQQGIVHHVHETADGREEWSEPLCESPIRDVFGGWVWDLVADPRGLPNKEQP